ncbi:hypothetical protein HZA44_03680 [Candidatus Peregrinibacteria bacterium]|nr:hypothetical protein [Candidatus Peregrinibacteria bacterium]
MNQKILLSSIVLSLAFSGVAYAHNPRIVEGGAVTNIENPEASQAFYGTLNGKSQLYFIQANEPFTLYAGLLAPDAPNTTKDFSAEIIQVVTYVDGHGQNAPINQAIGLGGKKTTLFTLDGTHAEWKRFYEAFGDDWYWQGPETAPMDSTVAPSPAGLYEIKVSNPKNQGPYVLVVGTEEQWGLREIGNTLLTMPRQKIFLGKSPYSAFFNRIGLTLLPPLLILVCGIALAIFLIKKHFKRIRKTHSAHSKR